MTKIAIISDTHIGCKAFNKSFFDRQMKYFENEFFPFILKNKIKHVLHLGDMAHNRNFVDLYVLQQFKDRFCQWFDDNDVILHALIGNHDTYYKSHIRNNFQRGNLMDFKNIKIIDTPEVKQIEGYNIGFVPWETDHRMINLPEITDVDIIAGHFEMSNILMQGNIYSRSGMDSKKFKDYKLVMSGHYHATSQKGNILYVGTQYQTNWGDYNNKKGFWLLGEDMQMEYIENEYSPKHFKVFYKEVDGAVQLTYDGNNGIVKGEVNDIIEVINNNYIKFIVEEYSDQVLLRKYFEKLTENSFDRVDMINDTLLVDQDEVEKLEDEIEEELQFIDVLRNYIKKVEFNQDIDSDVLLEKIDALVEQSKELQGI